MKTKTTLAALLLAAVMVTPSYGADETFLQGAKDCLRNCQDKKVESYYAFGTFDGYVEAMWSLDEVDTPDGVTLGQLTEVVAKYIDEHPAERHEYEEELIKRACKEAWPKENAHVQTTKRVKRRPFGRGNADAVARDGN